jgi:hypothetical protein
MFGLRNEKKAKIGYINAKIKSGERIPAKW